MAQQAFVVSGGDIISSVGSVSLSVGQVFYKVKQNNSYELVEGVHQSVLSVVTRLDAPPIELKIGPNPTSDFLELKCLELHQHMSYRIYDNKGLLQQKNAISNVMTRINMAHLPPAVYHLIILEGDEAFKSLKIIKR